MCETGNREEEGKRERGRESERWSLVWRSEGGERRAG